MGLSPSKSRLLAGAGSGSSPSCSVVPKAVGKVNREPWAGEGCGAPLGAASHYPWGTRTGQRRWGSPPPPSHGALLLLGPGPSGLPPPWRPTPPPGAHCSLPLGPSGCARTAKPSAPPGTDLRSLSLGAQPRPSISGCGLLAKVSTVWAALTPLCPQPSCCAFLRLGGPSVSAHLLVGEVASLGAGSFSPSQLPLGQASPIRMPFLFFFCSTHLRQGFFFALFGGVRSSASIR